MKSLLKRTKGITIIALTITIIVLLILAGISVATLFGENGLFKSASAAREKTEIANYQEIINLNTTYAHTNYKETNPENILKIIKEELQKDEKFKEAKITGPDKNEEEKKLIIVTKEGYVFYVYEENNKYIGKKDEIGETELNIEIKEGDIKYTTTPEGWTKEDIKVNIEIKKEEYKDYKIQYSYDGEKWSDYTEEIIVKENNTTILSRLTTGISTTKTYSSITITNIDKENPKIKTDLAASEVTTKGFKVSVKVEDTSSGLGKIIWYYKKSTDANYTAAEEEYKEAHSTQAGTTTEITKEKTYDNLESGTYHAYAEIYDVAGNEVATTTLNNITLGIVTGLTEANTTYIANPSGWTNQNVTLTASTNLNGFTIQTTKTPTVANSWEDKASQTFTANGTMYTRLWDGKNGGTYSSGNVSNIDKQGPSIITNLTSSNVTENGFKISVRVQDTKSGLGKIIWYHKKSDEDSYTPSEEIYTELNGAIAGTKEEITKEKTYDNLTSGGTYNIYAEIFDVAGNKVRVPEKGTIEEIVKKIDGQITLSENSGTYTSEAGTFIVTNNISGGTLKVTSSNTNIATATISENIVTVTPGTTEGTAIITVTSEATGTYNEATAEFTATVGHNFASKTMTNEYLANAAGCNNATTYYYKCTRCSEKGTETYTNGSALGHDPTTGGSLKTAATCTAPAVYYHKCSRCGVDLSTTYTSGNALGHNPTTGGSLKTAATCTAPAVYYHKCSRCGIGLSTTYTSGNALGHNYQTSYIAWNGTSFTSSTHDNTNHVTTFIYNHSTEDLTSTVTFTLKNDAQKNTGSSYAWQLKGGSSGPWYAGGAWTTSGLNWALKSTSGSTYASGTAGYQVQYQKTDNTLSAFQLDINGYGVAPYGLNISFNLPDVRKHKCTRCNSEYYDYNG